MKLAEKSQVTPNPEEQFLQSYQIGGANPFFLICGPCVIESYELLEEVASALRDLQEELGILIVFKSSFDKANRSSVSSFRGPGEKEGLRLLQAIKDKYSLSLLTDVHEVHQIDAAAEVCDILQIPAFLSRQTDLIEEAAKSGRWLNVKKGQFMAPLDALKIIEKCQAVGSDKVTICERGYTFGYNNLVVDMRSLEILRREGVHVVMDATHSTQLPGGGSTSGGQREMAYPIARAAAAVGVDGFFMEAHPRADEALSDASNQLFLSDMQKFVSSLLQIDALVKGRG